MSIQGKYGPNVVFNTHFSVIKMNSKTKQDECINCKQVISCDRSKCFQKCPSCKTENLFLCHTFPLQVGSDLIIQCKKPACIRQYTLINCPNCLGFMAINSLNNGNTYVCPCGFTSTLVVCAKLKHILSLPSSKLTERYPIYCKSCKETFQYKKCPQEGCRALAYAIGDSQTYSCSKKSCPSKLNKMRGETSFGLFPKINLCAQCHQNKAGFSVAGCPHKAFCEVCAIKLRDSGDGCPNCLLMDSRTTNQYAKIPPTNVPK